MFCLLSKHFYLKACWIAQSVQRCHVKCHVPSNDMGLENAQRCDNSPLRCLLKCNNMPHGFSQPPNEKYTSLKNLPSFDSLINLQLMDIIDNKYTVLYLLWGGRLCCVKLSNNEVMYLYQIIVLVHCVHMEHHLFCAVCVSSVCVRGARGIN